MTGIDWIIIAVYIGGLIAMSVFVGRGQESEEDYYVGGRDLPWWAVGVSTMATQTGVISFISIPAFVALREGGGLTWLQYELAVPLAMIAVMVLLIPFFRKLELISIYEYLEMRFSRRVRLFLSGVFLLSRGLATGVSIYATALVIQVCTGLDLRVIIAIVGVVTIIYDTIGGMKAVVWSDVVQMGVLLGGLVLCIVYAVDLAGGVDAVIDSISIDRVRALDMSSGLTSSEGAPFWAYLVGGLFLYASYYGADQSQAQRELSAPTLADTKKSLVLNGLARFPLTLGYLVLGIALAGAYLASPELQTAVAGSKIDYLVPEFVVTILPGGVRALLIAAMLAAAMSSLDSALNSLSAATMRDFIHGDREMPAKRVLKLSKVTTVVWGLIITGMAFFVGGIGDTVVEGINKIGSAFYGPILAAFVIGVLSRSVTARGIMAGIIAGVAVNIGLWTSVPQVHWMWWNVIGFAVAVVAAYVVSYGDDPLPARVIEKYTLSRRGMILEESKWLRTYAVLFGYFLLILGIGVALTCLAS